MTTNSRKPTATLLNRVIRGKALLCLGKAVSRLAAARVAEFKTVINN